MHKSKHPADPSGIANGLDMLESTLKKYRLENKKIIQTRLVVEELMNSLIGHSGEADEMSVSVRKMFGDITVEVSVPGDEYDFDESLNFGVGLDASEIGSDTELTIRNIILRAFAGDFKYKNSRGVNTVRLSVLKSPQKLLYRTLFAMFLAIAVGTVLKLISADAFILALCDNLLLPVKTMFMNSLKMVLAPVVFFSIVSCIGQFGDLAEIGKIGGKTMSLYVFTTLLATVVGMGSFFLLKPGDPALMGAPMDSSVVVEEVEVSLVDVVVGIVPPNFVDPFLESNMLQLIFLAVLCGIAVGMIGGYSELLSNFFKACNELFLKVTTIIIKFMPVATFCSVLLMLLTTGIRALVTLLSMCLTLVFALVVMMIIYGLIIIALGRESPLPIFKKYVPTMMQTFSLGSSCAAIPLNMAFCEKKMGISPKIYSLSLPLGATLNMDGTCVYLGVFALSLARIYGVEISSAALFSVAFSISVLSVGAPGIPGTGLICLSVLLSQINVPVEAIGLVIGIDPLIGMVRAMSNCLGDVVITTAVAMSENMIDIDTYYKQE